MFEVLKKSTGKCVCVKIDGVLVHADYKKLVPILEQIIREHGGVRCLCEIVKFRGMTPHALWDEIKFDVKHCHDIERCAIVGHRALHDWMTRVGAKIFRNAEMKYFDASQADEAWEWLTEGIEGSHSSEMASSTMGSGTED